MLNVAIQCKNTHIIKELRNPRVIWFHLRQLYNVFWSDICRRCTGCFRSLAKYVHVLTTHLLWHHILKPCTGHALDSWTIWATNKCLCFCFNHDTGNSSFSWYSTLFCSYCMLKYVKKTSNEKITKIQYRSNLTTNLRIRMVLLYYFIKTTSCLGYGLIINISLTLSVAIVDDSIPWSP